MLLNFFNKSHGNHPHVCLNNASHCWVNTFHSGIHPHMVGKISGFETWLPGSKSHWLILPSWSWAITLTTQPQVPCLGNRNSDSNSTYLIRLLSLGLNEVTYPKGLAQSLAHRKDPITVNEVNIKQRKEATL